MTFISKIEKMAQVQLLSIIEFFKIQIESLPCFKNVKFLQQQGVVAKMALSKNMHTPSY